MSSSKDIEQALQPLIGKPLTDMWQYEEYQRFEFGEQCPSTNRKGEAITVADWAVVVACAWQVTGPEGPVISSDDYRKGITQSDNASSFFDMMSENILVVETIEAEENGSARLHLSHRYTLEVQTDDSREEQWRFMPKEIWKEHFVVPIQNEERH